MVASSSGYVPRSRVGPRSRPTEVAGGRIVLLADRVCRSTQPTTAAPSTSYWNPVGAVPRTGNQRLGVWRRAWMPVVKRQVPRPQPWAHCKRLPRRFRSRRATRAGRTRPRQRARVPPTTRLAARVGDRVDVDHGTAGTGQPRSPAAVVIRLVRGQHLVAKQSCTGRWSTTAMIVRTRHAKRALVLQTSGVHLHRAESSHRPLVAAQPDRDRRRSHGIRCPADAPPRTRPCLALPSGGPTR